MASVSTAPRLFVDPARLASEGPVFLSGAEHHYLTRVLRLRVGDAVVLLDGQGRLCEATVCRIDASQAELQCQAALHAPPVPTQLTLYCGLLKGDKQDFVTQKATELGVHRLVPVACQRSVPQLHEDRAERRQQRWTKIAQAAAQQSRRADIPEVTGPLSFAAALADSAQVSSVLRLLLFEGSAPPLHTVIHQPLQALAPPQALAQLHLLIGPEGGFAPAELAAATDAGFVPVSLGPRILRAETAVVASLAVVQYALAAGA